VSKHYSGRSTRSSGGLGVLPFVLLVVLAVTAWNMHGGQLPSLHELQAMVP
jgi:hypothetical protein